MNRRNTMIIAAAVNAVLLAVLFITARHSEPEIEYSPKIAPIKILEPVPIVEKASEKPEKKPEVIAKPAQIIRNPVVSKPVVSKAELAAQFADKNITSGKEPPLLLRSLLLHQRLLKLRHRRFPLSLLRA